MTALVLHHYFRSSSSWRVRWVLAEKGLAFDSIHVNLLAGDQSAADYRAKSPTGYVPALAIDGHVLSESVAICEYLDETRPALPLRPSDPFLRARMRQLVEIVNADTQPIQNLGVLKKVSEDRAVQAEWAAFFIARGLGAFERLLGTLRNELPPGPHALGPQFSLADVFLVPQLYNARRFGVDLGPFPLAVAIEESAKLRPAYAASHPDRFEPPAAP
jgi:maleylacetoacetate isomerase